MCSVRLTPMWAARRSNLTIKLGGKRTIMSSGMVFPTVSYVPRAVRTGCRECAKKRSAHAGKGAIAAIARKQFKFDLSLSRQAEALPSASSISASEAFSASLTVTPPSPKKPPSDEASATASPMSRSHVLTAAPSSGAFLSREAAT
jgi:hypothetical protein